MILGSVSVTQQCGWCSCATGNISFSCNNPAKTSMEAVSVRYITCVESFSLFPQAAAEEKYITKDLFYSHSFWLTAMATLLYGLELLKFGYRLVIICFGGIWWML